MRFYLGTHRPSWLTFVDVPLFISAPTIQRITWELRRTPYWHCPVWAFDSGAYMANSPKTGGNIHAPWNLDPDSYGSIVTRVLEQVGVPPVFAAPQDWPCEPGVRQVTGFTTFDHQELTIDSFEFLSREFYFVDWIPVLQGWRVFDYIRHMEMYEQRGINLTDAETVGLGSVCRRGSPREIIAIVEAVQAYALERYGKMLPLHGFGMNIAALRVVGHLLSSSDSLAWSQGAINDHIRLPGCTHKSQWCNNCPDYALQWYSKVLEAIDAPKQLSFDLIA